MGIGKKVGQSEPFTKYFDYMNSVKKTENNEKINKIFYCGANKFTVNQGVVKSEFQNCQILNTWTVESEGKIMPLFKVEGTNSYEIYILKNGIWYSTIDNNVLTNSFIPTTNQVWGCNGEEGAINVANNGRVGELSFDVGETLSFLIRTWKNKIDNVPQLNTRGVYVENIQDGQYIDGDPESITGVFKLDLVINPLTTLNNFFNQ
jgi:hypothetical protein